MDKDLPRRKQGRLAIIVTGFVLAVIGPTIALLLMGFLGPPPFLIHRDQMGQFENSSRPFQGAEVETKLFEDQSSARAASRNYADSLAKRSSVRTLDEQRHLREDNGNYELVHAIEGVLVRIEGPNRELVDAVFLALPFIQENPEKNLLWIVITKHLGAFLLGLGIYLVVILVLSSRAMSWACTVEPRREIEVETGDSLRHRLLALSSLERPFLVRMDEKGRIVAEWRLADASWTSILEKGGLRHRHTVILEFDDSTTTARVVQSTRNIRWSVGMLRSSAQMYWARSIADYRAAAGGAYGLFLTPAGWQIDEAYRYRYEVSEIVQPVLAAILEAGWTIKPVYTFFKPLGG